jgi:hypothetical protein
VLRTRVLAWCVEGSIIIRFSYSLYRPTPDCKYSPPPHPPHACYSKFIMTVPLGIVDDRSHIDPTHRFYKYCTQLTVRIASQINSLTCNPNRYLCAQYQVVVVFRSNYPLYTAQDNEENRERLTAANFQVYHVSYTENLPRN